MKKKFRYKLLEFFETYPEDSECLLVGGTIFQEKYRHYANKHAKDTGHKVIEVTREEMETPLKIACKASMDEEVPTEIVIHTRESLEALNKSDVVGIGKAMEIELPTRATKDDWIQAILDKQLEDTEKATGGRSPNENESQKKTSSETEADPESLVLEATNKKESDEPQKLIGEDLPHHNPDVPIKGVIKVDLSKEVVSKDKFKRNLNPGND